MRKAFKRIITISFVLALCLACFTAAAAAADLWTDHVELTDGTANSASPTDDCSWYTRAPYSNANITTEKQLASVAKLVNEGYKTSAAAFVYPDFQGLTLRITTNTDLSDYEWVPIGTPEHPFRGTIVVENGAKITGLKITAESASRGAFGLIGYADGASVTYLDLKGEITVSGSKDAAVGPVIGVVTGNGASLSNCKTDVTINADSAGTLIVGGLAGNTQGLSITDCENNSAISVETSADAYVGGLVGTGRNLFINGTKVYNNKDIHVTAASVYAGGIAAYLPEKNLNGTANTFRVSTVSNTADNNGKYLFSLGDIFANASSKAYVGGHIGKSEIGFTADNLCFIRNIYVSGGADAYAGGIIGMKTGSGSLNLASPSYITDFVVKDGNGHPIQEASSASIEISVDVTGKAYAGGIAGYAENVVIAKPYVGNHAESTTKTLAAISAKGAGSAGAAGAVAGYVSGASIAASTDIKATIYKVKLTADGVKAVGGLAGEASLESNLFADIINTSYRAVFYDKAEDIPGIEMTAGNTLYAGGLFGINHKSSGIFISGATELTKASIKLNLNADHAAIGGFFGLNQQSFTNENLKVSSCAVTLVASGTDLKLGGVVGHNKASLDGQWSRNNPDNSIYFNNITLTSSSNNSYVGGIAGYAESGKISGIEAKDITLKAEKGCGNAVGVIAGKADAVISEICGRNMSVSLSSKATDNIAGGAAGVFGGAGSGAFDNISLYGKISNNGAGNTIGGLIGENNGNLKGVSLMGEFNLLFTRANGIIAGGLVGTNKGTIDAGYSSAKMEFTSNSQDINSFVIGGLAGKNEAGHSITNSFADVDINLNTQSAPAGTSYVGGLIGINEGSVSISYAGQNISFSAASGAAVNNVYAGGFTGNMTGGNIENCYVADTDINSDCDNVFLGGFTGAYSSGTISNCYTAAKISGTDTDHSGGFFAFYDDDKTVPSLTRCYFLQKSSVINEGLKIAAKARNNNYPDEQAAVHVRYIAPEVLKDKGTGATSFSSHHNSQWNFDTVWAYDSAEEETGYKYPYLLLKNEGNLPLMNTSWYTQYITGSAFHISTESEYNGFAAIVNGQIKGLDKDSFSGKTVYLDKSIIIQTDNPITAGDSSAVAFAGTFDGQNNRLSGIRMNRTVAAALFGYTAKTAEIRNLKLYVTAVRSSSREAAALVLDNKGTVSDVQLVIDEEISAATTAGAVAAVSTGNLKRISVRLTSSAALVKADCAGGIVGVSSNISLDTVSFTGNVSGASFAGGISGLAEADFKGKKLTVSTGSTGIISPIYAGGMTGKAQNILDSDISFAGKIGNGTYAGGIAAFADGTVKNASFTGTDAVLTGTEYLGGGIGLYESSAAISAVNISGISVKNISLKAEGVSGRVYLGGVFGKTENAFVTGITAENNKIEALHISTDTDLGGVSGYSHNSILDSISVKNTDVKLTGDSNAFAGGVVGDCVADTNIFNTYKIHSSDLLGLYQGVSNAVTENLKVSALSGISSSADPKYAASLTAYAGGIAGRISGASIYYSEVKTGKVSAKSYETIYAGGIAGLADGSYLVANTADSAVNAADALKLYAGGFAGNLNLCSLRYNKVLASSGKIAVSENTNETNTPLIYVGGFAGNINSTSSAITDHNSAEIPVDISNNDLNTIIYAGGFAGLAGYDNNPVNLYASYSKFNIKVVSKNADLPTGFGNYVGGFIGQLYCGNIDSCYAEGSVTENFGAPAKTGGFAASVGVSGSIKEAYAVSEKLSAYGSDLYAPYCGGFVADMMGSADGVYADVKTLDCTSSNTGTMFGICRSGSTVTNEYTSRPEIRAFKLYAANPDLSYLENHALNNMTVSSAAELGRVMVILDDESYYTFFSDGRTTAAAYTVKITKNLNFSGNTKIWDAFVPTNASVEGNGFTISNFSMNFASVSPAGFFSINNGQVKDIIFDKASVTGTGKLGIAAGVNNAGMQNITVKNSSLKGDSIFGFICGKNSLGGAITGAAVEACSLNADNASDCAGVVAGNNEGTINRAYVYGDYQILSAQGSFCFGGIAGRNSGRLTECLDGANLKLVLCSVNLGGIAGENTGKISNCMTASGSLIYALAAKDGTANAGGIAGYVRSGGKLTDCLSLSQIVVTDRFKNANAAGINGKAVAGKNEGSIDRSYFDKQLAPCGDTSATGFNTSKKTGINITGTEAFTAQTDIYPVLTWLKDTAAGKLSSAVLLFKSETPVENVNTAASGFELVASDVTMTNVSNVSIDGNKAVINATEGAIKLSTGNLSRTVNVGNASYEPPVTPPVTPVPSTPIIPTDPTVVVITVDGNTYNIGKLETDARSTTVVVDEDKLNSYMRTATKESSIIIPLSELSEKAKAVLSVQNLSNAADKNMSIELNMGDAQFTVKASSVDLTAIKEKFSATELKDIPLTFTVKKLSEDEKEELIQQTGKDIIGDVVSFSLTAGEGNSVYTVENFSALTSRVLPKVSGKTITTGVEILNGQAIHKPTNGRTIYSFTASEYAYIYNEAGFTDIEETWYEANVKEMASRLIIGGYGDGSFRGENSITRAEFATIMVGALGLHKDGDGTVFTDVFEDDWYCGVIGTAYDRGLIGGMGDGTFAPCANITRQEAMVILERTARLIGYEGKIGKLDEFADKADVADWALDAAKFNVGSGLFNGDERGLRPTDDISRAEAAVIIQRLLQKAGLIDIR